MGIRMVATGWLALVALGMPACGGGEGGSDPAPADGAGENELSMGPTHYQARAGETLLLGPGDNAEVVKLVPGTGRAVLLASKARKLVLLEVAGDKLKTLREKSFFPADPGESELTHVACSPDGSWAVITRTLIEVDGGGQQVDCGGELLFVSLADSDQFGTLLAQLPVGPMPDSVALSDDGLWAVSANERDGPDAWGKCEVAGKEPSVSVVSLAAGPSAPAESARLRVMEPAGVPREPESVAIGKDNDLVAVTLQDSHELLLFRISEVVAANDPTTELPTVKIIRLPDDDTGAGPWPDGVARLEAQGQEYFVIAGEWNDTITIVGSDGTVIGTTAIAPGDIPPLLPRVLAEGYPRFSPDSVAAFVANGRPHAAFTLRHSGAVLFYDLSYPADPVLASAVGVGKDEQGGQDEDGSTIRPEGLAAAPDGTFLLVANEGESSVTLLLREEL